MREKIKELADIATNSVPKGKLEVAEWISEYNQKLAELIINECITAVEGVKKFPTTTYERDMTDTQTVDKCIQAIKDKFE